MAMLYRILSDKEFLLYVSLPIILIIAMIVIELTVKKTDFVGPYPESKGIIKFIFSYKEFWGSYAVICSVSFLNLVVAIYYCLMHERTYAFAGFVANILVGLMAILYVGTIISEKYVPVTKLTMLRKWGYVFACLFFFMAGDFMQECSFHGGCHYSAISV